MTLSVVTVVDYGMGNLQSVVNALQFLDCKVLVSKDPRQIELANALILPGVGSFRRAMERLASTGLDASIRKLVCERQRPILGICLGMQLLGCRSSEDGETKGLGLIPVGVDRLSADAKVPHTGFNSVYQAGMSLFRGLPQAADFYFVHSYRMRPEGLEGRVATCHHGESFVAAYEDCNIYATQFHPERSQTNGLILLRNFIKK